MDNLEKWNTRSIMLLGEKGCEALKKSKVAVCGVGGVGSWCAEALCRSSVGELLLIDGDTVSVTNINRQLPALYSTVGKYKTDVLKNRFFDINPDVVVETHNVFIDVQTDSSVFDGCDYVVDAIDDVKAKVRLAQIAVEKNIPIISAMGCGNKLYPQLLEIADIFDTSVCPLCRVMRYELRRASIEKLTVVYSKEPPVVLKNDNDKRVPSSMIFVPAAAGLMIANRVVLDLIKEGNDSKDGL